MPIHDIYDPPCYVWECDQCGAAGDDRMIERAPLDGGMQAFCSTTCEIAFVWPEHLLRRGSTVSIHNDKIAREGRDSIMRLDVLVFETQEFRRLPSIILEAMRRAAR